eukprot:GILI01024115.1.p1 GENE.GILI01024115.1~~GILI01024115.1.p1  ORF type:complete len:242 (-),score=27.52 GILI01024115.1:138-863(-)
MHRIRQKQKWTEWRREKRETKKQIGERRTGSPCGAGGGKGVNAGMVIGGAGAGRGKLLAHAPSTKNLNSKPSASTPQPPTTATNNSSATNLNSAEIEKRIRAHFKALRPMFDVLRSDLSRCGLISHLSLVEKWERSMKRPPSTATVFAQGIERSAYNGRSVLEGYRRLWLHLLELRFAVEEVRGGSYSHLQNDLTSLNRLLSPLEEAVKKCQVFEHGIDKAVRMIQKCIRKFIDNKQKQQP